MSDRIRPRLVSYLLASAALVACKQDPVGPAPQAETLQPARAPQTDPLQAYDFAEYHADFPFRPHTPRRQPGKWYTRNREQALEKVAANLSGRCSADAWKFAKEFFDRHQEAAVELLISATDKALQSPGGYDHAENMVYAMGRLSEPRFARVLERAAQHSKPGIRRAAVSALIHAGDAEAVMSVFQRFQYLSDTVKRDWIKAAVAHLDEKRLAEVFRPIVTQTAFGPLRDFAFAQLLELEPEKAVRFFEPIWTDFPEDLALHVAGVFHAAGRKEGRARIHRALKPPIEEVRRKLVALKAVLRGDPIPFKDALLRLTNESHQGLNVMLMQALAQIPGDVVTNAIRVLNDPNGPLELRQMALRVLALRGVTQELDELVDVVRSQAGGMAFQRALVDLTAARYAKVVPALLVRAKEAAAEEQPRYVKLIASFDTPSAFLALKELFVAEEKPFGVSADSDTNVVYVGKMLSNVKSSYKEAIQLAKSLPRADYRRRGVLIFCLANMAAAYEPEQRPKDIDAYLRGRIHDRKELPQIRMLALDYLRKAIVVDDVMKIRRGLGKETKAMRNYLSDYLNEFF